MLGARDGAVGGDLPVPGEHAGPVGGLPNVEPEDGPPRGRCVVGHGILQSSVDRKPFPATPASPGRGHPPRGPAVSYQSSETATPASATPPPGPHRGRDGRPYAGARSAAQTGLPASYPTPGKCINGVSNSSFLAVMGIISRSLLGKPFTYDSRGAPLPRQANRKAAADALD